MKNELGDTVHSRIPGCLLLKWRRTTSCPTLGGYLYLYSCPERIGQSTTTEGAIEPSKLAVSRLMSVLLVPNHRVHIRFYSDTLEYSHWVGSLGRRSREWFVFWCKCQDTLSGVFWTPRGCSWNECSSPGIKIVWSIFSNVLTRECEQDWLWSSETRPSRIERQSGSDEESVFKNCRVVSIIQILRN